MRALLAGIGIVLLLQASAALAAFDHEHRVWTGLLERHVTVVAGGNASRVDYAGLARERGALKAYLDGLAAVTRQEYAAWGKSQQLAFLINAYNAFMIEKVLTRYPDIASVWDFGKLFGNPFKDKFFRLLGQETSLDGIEHGMIRAEGAFEDPRIHFAVNCASIGCPMLRDEAYVGMRLERQLEEQTLRFLSDRSRNRYNRQTQAVEVSMIFDWYGKDFARGWKGYNSVEQFLAKHADVLADTPEERRALREQRAKVKFLDYDWGLNKVRKG